MANEVQDEDVTRCLSCPRGEKPVATFRWHPGFGTMPVCTEHAKKDLVEEEDMAEWEIERDPVTGFLTPIDKPRPKIRTWKEWHEYHKQEESDENGTGTEPMATGPGEENE